MNFHQGRAVRRVRAVETFDQTQLVDHLGDFGKDFADPLSAFSVLGKAIRAFHLVAGLGKLNSGFLTWIGFAVVTPEGWFVVKGIDL